MWKPLTGEPYAGDPPVRFGGRGGVNLSYPYHFQDTWMPDYNLGHDEKRLFSSPFVSISS
jgi:hypothetical protein